jgi:hypothetical protein
MIKVVTFRKGFAPQTGVPRWLIEGIGADKLDGAIQRVTLVADNKSVVQVNVHYVPWRQEAAE